MSPGVFPGGLAVGLLGLLAFPRSLVQRDGSGLKFLGTLDVLANDLRFKEDEELRMAVAAHPRVTPATAEKVTADFKVPQIRKLLARPGLSQSLREKLFRKTTQR